MKKKNRKRVRTRFIDHYLDKMIDVLEKIDKKSLEKIVKKITETYKSNKSIFLIGNGGSASTATHLAADIGKNTIVNYKDPFAKRIKIFSLCDNVPWITAVSNDLSFDDVFAEQLKNLANEGDLLIVISGSGDSTNIIKAAVFANKIKMQTIGILGFDGGFVKELLDFSLVVDSSDYGIVESVHSYIHHYIVESLKNKMIVKLK
jgi:D-sedoheptulose 7-phosphate isomerase